MLMLGSFGEVIVPDLGTIYKAESTVEGRKFDC